MVVGSLYLQEHQVFPFDGSMTEASVMNYLLHEALPLTVPYGAQTLSTIAYHPVKVRLSCNCFSSRMRAVCGIPNRVPNTYWVAHYISLAKPFSVPSRIADNFFHIARP